jgi:hypothetical protein
MSRVHALVLAGVVGLVAFVAGWLLFASAAEPDLPEPIVVDVPITGGETVPPSTTPSIVPPPTVGPPGPPGDADDPGDDDNDDVDDGVGEGGGDDGGDDDDG